MDLATASDLAQWAESRDAQARLPQLVRRLIDATADGLTRLTFRAGEGVALPGWDRIAEAVRASAFVPAGLSGWEMGVGDPGPKANEDYRKRTGDSGEVDPATSTFVFVTLRRWPGKSDWVAQCRAEGGWKDVVAYNADDLETWLESAPAVHAWASAFLGKDPYEAESLETWWEAWSAATRPRYLRRSSSPGAKRRWHNCVERFETSQVPLRWLPTANTRLWRSSPQLSSPTMARRSSKGLSSSGRLRLGGGSRCQHRPLCSCRPSSAQRSRRPSRPAITSYSPSAGRSRAREIELPRLRRGGIEAALTEAGVSRDRASALATLGRRSILSLHRTLALNPDAELPEWARLEHAPDIVPAVLAGSWSDASEGDREAVAAIAGRPYPEVVRSLTRWLHASDPPIRRVGNVWMIAAKVDAWGLTARALTTDDLNRFRGVAVSVLGADDPALELPPEQRVLAGILAREQRHSGHLLHGLADALALMATASNDVPLAGDRRGADETIVITRSLLTSATRTRPASAGRHCPAYFPCWPRPRRRRCCTPLRRERGRLMALCCNSSKTAAGRTIIGRDHLRLSSKPPPLVVATPGSAARKMPVSPLLGRLPERGQPGEEHVPTPPRLPQLVARAKLNGPGG